LLLLSPTLVISYYYFFFFQRYVAHRDLHSFPTRRSSDLRRWCASRVVTATSSVVAGRSGRSAPRPASPSRSFPASPRPCPSPPSDRKSTRLNSSHVSISYAVFCLKKKTKQEYSYTTERHS